MARLFRRHPRALAETLRFAESLGFSLSDLEYNYPDEPTEVRPRAAGRAGAADLGGARRSAIPTACRTRCEALIRARARDRRELNYARYFLTVHDIVKFARSRKILCQGRGSAANSVICYCLGITDVGPDIIDTLFERFISKERNEPPDIDVDFEHERRDEVIAYIYEKYSAEAHRAGGFRRHLSRPLGHARSGQGDGPFGRCAQRPFRLDLGLVVIRSSAKGRPGAGGLDRPIRLVAACHRPRQRDHGISPPPFPACRRLRHHPGPPRRDRADRQDGDGRAQDGRMGQGRPRRGEDPQGRRAGARHAVVPAPRLRPARRSLRRPGRPRPKRWSWPRSRRRTSASTT